MMYCNVLSQYSQSNSEKQLKRSALMCKEEIAWLRECESTSSTIMSMEKALPQKSFGRRSCPLDGHPKNIP